MSGITDAINNTIRFQVKMMIHGYFYSLTPRLCLFLLNFFLLNEVLLMISGIFFRIFFCCTAVKPVLLLDICTLALRMKLHGRTSTG